MNIEQLRRALADHPGHMPIVVDDSSVGWMENATLYLAPRHIDRRISDNFRYARHREGADNSHALLISAFHQSDGGFLESLRSRSGRK